MLAIGQTADSTVKQQMKALRKHGYLFWLWMQRDVKSRYAGSVGGLFWALLQPVFTIALFYVVFALVLQVKVPELANSNGYFLYLLSGLLPWLSISDGIARATGSLVGQEQFLQKVVFPLEIIPATVIVTSLITQLIGTIFLLLFLVMGDTVSLRWLLLPVILACQLVMTLGLGCTLAVLGVHSKDLLQITPVLLQFLFYSAPILYSQSFIAPGYHKFLLLNPFTALLEAYHWVLLGIPLYWPSVLALVFWLVVCGVGGWLLFRLLKPTLGDYL